MTDARLRSFWHRAGPLTAFAALATVAATQGCGGGGDTGSGGSGGGKGGGHPSTTTGPGPSSTSTTTTGTGGSSTTTTGPGGATTSSTGPGGGGMGGTGGGMPSPPISSVKPAGNGVGALDATPDPDGTNLYFTAYDPVNGPGVFKVPADGSNPTPSVIATGAPFAAPFGITISSDGKQLYVADAGAITDPMNPYGTDHGAIFVLPVGGGTPTAIAGSDGASPRSLEIAIEGGSDVIYFTGVDKTNGKPGVFKLPVGGGTAMVVAEGPPFVDPSGIVIAKDGTVYVADTVAAATGLANIIKITGGNAAPFLQDLRVGYPCGVALSKDEVTLLVSSLDPDKKTDQVLQVDIGSMQAMPFTMGIDTNYEAAGLHRARNADVYAWADTKATPMGMTGTGTVFVIK